MWVCREHRSLSGKFRGDTDTWGPETSSSPSAREGTTRGQVIQGDIVQAFWVMSRIYVFKIYKVAGTPSSFNPCPVLIFAVFINELLKRDPFSYRAGGFALIQFFLTKICFHRTFFLGLHTHTKLHIKETELLLSISLDETISYLEFYWYRRKLLSTLLL